MKYWDLQLDHQYDFGVVVSFRYLIRPNILKFIRYNTINAHPSILPRYRGPAPIYQQILHNEENSGVSIIEIDPSKFDNGKIIEQVPFTIRQTMTYPQYRIYYYFFFSLFLFISLYFFHFFHFFPFFLFLYLFIE